MKFVLAPDSFKESMTAKEVADAMEKGIRRVYPNIECIKVPMADGGEGTVQSLVDGTNGKIYKVKVTGPLGEPVEAMYGVLGDKITAVIEMAEASGIHYVEKEKRNPMITTSFGTGELVKEALGKGVKKIIIGIGGSVTNDGGAGMVQALGAKLLDKNGKEIGLGGAALKELHKIDISSFDKRISSTEIEVACDVTNPLAGENGATKVFGPQKGATKEMIKILDNNLTHYGEVIKKQLGKDVATVEGSGAAGGLGTALLAFCDAKLSRGIDIVIKYTNLEEKVKDADYVFTGEGSIDSQTRLGKTPYGVAKVASKYNIPVIALTGNIGKGAKELYQYGFTSIFSIVSGISTLENALKEGKKNIEDTIEDIVKLL